MPGLLRGVARTAVVAGTASAVSGRVQRRQAERFADRDAEIYVERQQAYDQQMAAAYPPAAPPPAPAARPDRLSQLERLGQLRSQGLLTDEEFQAEKARLLAS
ncbi:SHOCT domain-containing protein [Egicoccus sp. AB-alg2]|uniref:SHOCT domain-containing protein n=1 Tax=Egicoccus sp. AB-alg2 TaxID=3242693 RepID=UPI00359D4677